ncbi:hypothetical protein [Nocardia farcinica]|uniref:hypothetical protein n=1 Tax=Nocardia farcinica TaxID=37329 RepID=UPI0024553E2A|nr:hypothetical protein [Nocardia farcinica]
MVETLNGELDMEGMPSAGGIDREPEAADIETPADEFKLAAKSVDEIRAMHRELEAKEDFDTIDRIYRSILAQCNENPEHGRNIIVEFLNSDVREERATAAFAVPGLLSSDVELASKLMIQALRTAGETDGLDQHYEEYMRDNEFVDKETMLHVMSWMMHELILQPYGHREIEAIRSRKHD